MRAIPPALPGLGLPPAAAAHFLPWGWKIGRRPQRQPGLDFAKGDAQVRPAHLGPVTKPVNAPVKKTAQCHWQSPENTGDSGYSSWATRIITTAQTPSCVALPNSQTRVQRGPRGT
jgi:hypothetical protein